LCPGADEDGRQRSGKLAGWRRIAVAAGAAPSRYHSSDGAMSQELELDRKVKTAINETSLLIPGVQVWLGFELQSFFTGIVRISIHRDGGVVRLVALNIIWYAIPPAFRASQRSHFVRQARSEK
jgi:hypothetical protein